MPGDALPMQAEASPTPRAAPLQLSALLEASRGLWNTHSPPHEGWGSQRLGFPSPLSLALYTARSVGGGGDEFFLPAPPP